MNDPEKFIHTIEIGDDSVFLQIKPKFVPPPPPVETIKQSQVELALKKSLGVILSAEMMENAIEQFKTHMGWH